MIRSIHQRCFFLDRFVLATVGTEMGSPPTRNTLQGQTVPTGGALDVPSLWSSRRILLQQAHVGIPCAARQHDRNAGGIQRGNVHVENGRGQENHQYLLDIGGNAERQRARELVGLQAADIQTKASNARNPNHGHWVNIGKGRKLGTPSPDNTGHFSRE